MSFEDKLAALKNRINKKAQELPTAGVAGNDGNMPLQTGGSDLPPVSMPGQPDDVEEESFEKPSEEELEKARQEGRDKTNEKIEEIITAHKS